MYNEAQQEPDQLGDLEALLSRQSSNESRDNTFEVKRRKQPLLQVASLAVFLISWVGNGEILQAITTGSFGLEKYGKPVFITWFSYNFMALSILPVYLCNRKREVSFYTYYQQEWAGKLGIFQCSLGCTFISYMLQLLNILMIVGLQCISVSLSNAIYQLQTVFTVFLSVTLLKEKLVTPEIVGLIVASFGIAMIVIPPMVQDGESSSYQSCPWHESNIFAGFCATLVSAAIGGAYLVFWRVFDSARHFKQLDPRDGLLDTLMSLAMIGCCNLFFGWPMVVFAHYSEWESFEWPLSPVWLCLNGIVEYVFDASCAFAIYETSPVMVAVVSPLTIPLSIIIDQRIDASIVPDQSLSWVGIGLVMAGVYFLERKPALHPRFSRCFSILRCACKLFPSRHNDKTASNLEIKLG